MRTRVGYAGGRTHSPTYHSLADHAEAIEVDYDPAVLTYSALLELFWRGHDPRRPARSTQYRSAILTRTDEEHALALASRDALEGAVGTVHTAVVPLDRFWPAESYHQKYRLRNTPDLYAEFREIYPDDLGLVASTAAARVNGWLDGCASAGTIEAALPAMGLSDEAGRVLLARERDGGDLSRLLR